MDSLNIFYGDSKSEKWAAAVNCKTANYCFRRSHCHYSYFCSTVTFFVRAGNLNENFLITFGLEGGLSDQELRLLIKVLPMTQEEFKQFEQDDDWSSSDDDDDENDGEFEMVTYSKMNRMNKKLKRCFEIVANSYLERFHSSPNKKAKSLLTIQAPDDLDNPVELHRWREARSLSLIEGQEHILARLIDAVAN